MRCLRHAVLIGSVLAAGGVVAQGGLQVRAGDGITSGTQAGLRWQQFQLDVTTLRLGERGATWGPLPIAASLGGDIYFSKDIVEPGAARSGFRASGAVLIRPPGVSLTELAWSSRALTSFGAPAYLSLPSASSGVTEPGLSSYSTMPYLGVGYSGMLPKSSWGFWADVGLVVQSPGQLSGVGRVLSGTQGADDLIRDLRLSPMLQLGVNYSF